MPRVEIPSAVDNIDEAFYASRDAAEVFRINGEVDQRAKEFDLTDDEIIELRDAYVWEQLTSPVEQALRKGLGRNVPGQTTTRSSEEILENARQRKLQQPIQRPSVMDYYD